MASEMLPLFLSMQTNVAKKRAVIRKQRALKRKQEHIRKRNRVSLMFFLVIVAYVEQIPVRRVWLRPRSSGFWQVVEGQWTDNEWTENFRMSKETFDKLCRELAPFIQRRDTNYRKAVPVRQRLAIALYRLADTANYRTIANLFGVGKSTVCGIVNEVCSFVVEVLFERLIKFPTGRPEISQEINSFSKRAGFPQVVGAIDGCHIPIIAPTEHHDNYVNRKGFYSIILQGLVDSSYLFRDVYAGWPGRVHDARVFKNSPLYDACVSRKFLPLYLSKRICGVVVPPLILGDSAYGQADWLMKPFTDRGNLTEKEIDFNTAHAKTRVVVENAFGRLKGRFRCLGKRLDQSVVNANVTTTACCILHNYCELMKEDFNDDWLDGVLLHMNIPSCDRQEKQDREADLIRNAITEFIAP